MIKNPRNLSEPIRFITDHNLGKLARWLRLLGYDTLCHEGKTNKDLWSRALKENRIVLTRKKNLQYFPEQVETVIITDQGLELQLSGLLAMLSLEDREGCFLKVCSLCNASLKRVDKKDILDMIPSYIQNMHDLFYLCPDCNKVYWQGSHVTQIKETLRKRSLMDPL